MASSYKQVGVRVSVRINLKTAKQISLTIPTDLLGRATKIIK
jgi:hypothetical protein